LSVWYKEVRVGAGRGGISFRTGERSAPVFQSVLIFQKVVTDGTLKISSFVPKHQSMRVCSERWSTFHTFTLSASKLESNKTVDKWRLSADKTIRLRCCEIYSIRTYHVL